MKRGIRRASTMSAVARLPDRALLSGTGKTSNPIVRITERSLVRKISCSIHSNSVHCSVEAEEGNFRNVAKSQKELKPSPLRVGGRGPAFQRSKTDPCPPRNFGGGLTATLASGPSDHLRLCVDEPFGNSSGCFSIAKDLANDLSAAPLRRKEMVIKELLGVGAFSQVFAVSQIHLKDNHDTLSGSADECDARQQLRESVNGGTSQVVVKHLNRKLLRRPQEFYQAAIHLKQEATLLSQIDHPNIIRLRGLALGGTLALQSGKYNDYFLVLDRLTDTLDQRVEQWKSTTSPGLFQKVQYAHQLASALSCLHKRRLVFRDLKPQNVGFLPNGMLQLFDFGFCRSLPVGSFPSRHADKETFCMSMAGTIRYMAPEIQTHQSYNCKIDVYSWSILAYEMIAEEKAYAHYTKTDHFLDLVCMQEIRPNLEAKSTEHLPDSLKKVLAKAWCGSIEQRLTMDAVLEQMSPILNSLKEDSEHGNVNTRRTPVEYNKEDDPTFANEDKNWWEDGFVSTTISQPSSSSPVCSQDWWDNTGQFERAQAA